MTAHWRNDTSIRRLGVRRTLPEKLLGHAVRRRASFTLRGERVQIAIDDISASGVGFYGPPSPLLVEKEPLLLKVGHTETNVRIRWVDRSPTRQAVRYGAEFTDPAPALVPLVEEMYGFDSGPDQPMRD
jgi:hypothetical protein